MPFVVIFGQRYVEIGMRDSGCVMHDMGCVIVSLPQNVTSGMAWDRKNKDNGINDQSWISQIAHLGSLSSRVTPLSGGRVEGYR